MIPTVTIALTTVDDVSTSRHDGQEVGEVLTEGFNKGLDGFIILTESGVENTVELHLFESVEVDSHETVGSKMNIREGANQFTLP